jgi:hypothetical protein
MPLVGIDNRLQSRKRDYLRRDLQSTFTAPVLPKYRKLAAQIAEDPKKFTGQFIPLMDVGPEGPIDYLEIESLDSFTTGEIETGFREHKERSAGQLHIIFYERVSTEGQALNGTRTFQKRIGINSQAWCTRCGHCD